MDIHWRNTQKPVRFFFMDARVFAVFLFFLVHARPWTFCLVVFFSVMFWLFERRGLTFPAALRAFRSWILGRHRPANTGRARRRVVDYNGR